MDQQNIFLRGLRMAAIIFGVFLALQVVRGWWQQPQHQPSPHHVKLESAEHLRTLLAERPLVLLDYTAGWCPPCRQLKPNLHALANAYPEHLKVVAIDVDRHRELARRAGVEAIPNLRLVADGEEVARLVGYQSEAALREWVAPHLPANAIASAEAAQ